METLAERWLRSGVSPGDTLLVHSDITRTVLDYSRATKQRVGPEAVLDSILEAVGHEGTLLLPLFNFGFAEGKPFDIRTTPSHMGAMTEAARLHPNAVRTGHPVYSFAVIGKNAPSFEDLNNRSAYDDTSPFGILKELGGKIACLDLEDARSMTYYHHVEEVKQVDFRYRKEFHGDYTNSDGTTSKQTYEIYVRDLDKGVVSDANPAGELLWEAGLYQGSRPGIGTGLRVIDAKRMFEFVAALIDDGRALNTLYRIEK